MMANKNDINKYNIIDIINNDDHDDSDGDGDGGDPIDDQNSLLLLDDSLMLQQVPVFSAVNSGTQREQRKSFNKSMDCKQKSSHTIPEVVIIDDDDDDDDKVLDVGVKCSLNKSTFTSIKTKTSTSSVCDQSIELIEIDDDDSENNNNNDNQKDRNHSTESIQQNGKTVQQDNDDDDEEIQLVYQSPTITTIKTNNDNMQQGKESDIVTELEEYDFNSMDFSIYQSTHHRTSSPMSHSQPLVSPLVKHHQSSSSSSSLRLSSSQPLAKTTTTTTLLHIDDDDDDDDDLLIPTNLVVKRGDGGIVHQNNDHHLHPHPSSLSSLHYRHQFLSTTTTTSLLSLSSSSTKKPPIKLSGKKSRQLKSKQTNNKSTNNNNRKKKTARVIFHTDDEDEDENNDNIRHQKQSQSQSQQQSTIPIPNIKQADILQHIVVQLSSNILEMAREDIEKFFAEKKLDFEILSPNHHHGNDDDDDIGYVRWKAKPTLEQMFRLVCDAGGGGGGSDLVRIINGPDSSSSSSSSLFDHLLLVIPASRLHKLVTNQLKSINNDNDNNAGNDEDNDDDDNEEDLYHFLYKICHRAQCYNLTLILYGIDAYLRTQQRKENNSFRKRLNELMAAESAGSGGISSQRKTTKNKNTTKDKTPPIPALTMENIELALIDTRMRFHYSNQLANVMIASGGGGGGGGRKMNFSTTNLNNTEEFAMLLLRYTRSLAEQLYRKSKYQSTSSGSTSGSSSSSASNLHFNNTINSIDPIIGDHEAATTLWRRQLQQFPSISAQQVDLLVHTYPTPAALRRAIMSAAAAAGAGAGEAEMQNPIQMLAALKHVGGSNSNQRRVVIGNELAHKLVIFFTSKDVNKLLKSG